MSFALATLTIVHVAVSLVGISPPGLWLPTGSLLQNGSTRGQPFFLSTNIATSASGFLFSR